MSETASRHGRVRTDPRISRRRLAVARAQRRRALLRLLGVLLAGAVVWALFWSPLLDVRRVRVLGVEETPIEKVLSAAEIASGRNLLLLSTDEVARLVATLPWVASVNVDRMLPDTLRLRVTERRPALVLSLGAARWTLDRSGRVLEAGEARPSLPVLAGVQVGTVEPGVRLRTPEAVEALAVFRSLPQALRREVRALFAPTLERITFKLGDGYIVRYGAAEVMRAKNEVLGAVLQRVRAEKAGPAVIDVRVPTAPAVAPVRPGEVAGA